MNNTEGADQLTSNAELNRSMSRSVVATAFELRPFVPRRFLSNGHLQTILGNFVPRPNHLPLPVPELVEVSPAMGTQIATKVLCHCHWQPAKVRAARPTAIIVHGLEGSSDSQYVIGNANKLWRAGANIIRMNMRNCGGNKYEMTRQTPTLYHSGLSGDVGEVMRFFLERERLESIALIALLKRFRRKAMLFPRAFDPNRAVGVDSLREFDDRITALYSGFSSAEDYYFRAAAARVIAQISVPTLVLHALDDPFVQITPETLAALEANAYITLVQPAHGGHCAFLAKPVRSNHDDGYWAETTLLRFVLAHA